MATARFLLVGGLTPAGAAVPGWPGRSALHGTRNPDGTWTAWRLLGGNNRELGRSGQVHAGPAETLSAIRLFRARCGELTATHTIDERGLWRWRLVLDDAPVVVSARAYLRQRESHYSLAQFLAVARDAREPRTRAGAPPATPPVSPPATSRVSAAPPAPAGRPPSAPPTAQASRTRRMPVPRERHGCRTACSAPWPGLPAPLSW